VQKEGKWREGAAAVLKRGEVTFLVAGFRSSRFAFSNFFFISLCGPVVLEG
jgi:hypothetical protein